MTTTHSAPSVDYIYVSDIESGEFAIALEDRQVTDLDPNDYDPLELLTVVGVRRHESDDSKVKIGLPADDTGRIFWTRWLQDNEEVVGVRLT